jgi:hypothetical protein
MVLMAKYGALIGIAISIIYGRARFPGNLKRQIKNLCVVIMASSSKSHYSFSSVDWSMKKVPI